MRCPHCGRLSEPGDTFCIICGTKLESTYREEPGSYSEPAYKNGFGYQESYVSRPRQNNIVLYVIIGVLATVLVGLIAWLVFSHHQDNTEGPNTSAYVETQTQSPAETAPETATPTPTAEPEKTVAPAVKTGGYLLPESSSRRMTDADLSQLTHEELCFARNEIYARHGRIFDTPQVADYFESKSWYSGTIPANRFNESVLTDIERANVDIIFAYERSHYGGSYY